MWEQGSWRWREKANLESFLRIANLGVRSFMREGPGRFDTFTSNRHNRRVLFDNG